MIGSIFAKLFEKFPEIPIKNDIRYFLAFNRLIPKSISDLSPVKGYDLHYNLKKGDVVLDAGAFTGDYTIFAAKKVGNSGKVIALEPDAKNRKILIKNIKHEKLSNVIILPVGLWGSNQFIDANFNGLHSSIQNQGKNNIEVVKLDDLIKRLKIQKLDFIKMDIEGAEIEAIKGSVNTLKKLHPELAIASYHLVNGKPTSIFLEKFLSDLSYSVHSGFPKHQTTYAKFNH